MKIPKRRTILAYCTACHGTTSQTYLDGDTRRRCSRCGAENIHIQIRRHNSQKDDAT